MESATLTRLKLGEIKNSSYFESLKLLLRRMQAEDQDLLTGADNPVYDSDE